MGWRTCYRLVKTYGLRVSGVALVIGTVVYERCRREEAIAHASWTTNFEPSVKWDDNWDRRDPSIMVKPLKGNATDEEKKQHKDEREKKSGGASRHLLLLRHGQYYTDGAGDPQRYLTELGREQAKLAGLRLNELGYPYMRMVSSTMTRAIETADIIHLNLPSVPREQTDLLREGAPYPPEPPVGHWKPEFKQFHEDGARIEAAFRKYFHRADPDQESDTYEVFVCHANVIRYFVCRAMQFPPEAWLRMSLNHCSITAITIRPSGRVILRSLGNSGFMPAALQSSL